MKVKIFLETAAQSTNFGKHLDLGSELKRVTEEQKIKTIEIVAEVLKFNETLTSIDLSNNEIEEDRAKLIAEALKVNETLTSIDLSDNEIGEEGAKLIAEVLKENETLVSIDLSDNAIGEASVKTIVEALKINKTITNLNFAYNPIGKEGAKLIAEALKVNKTLTSINCSNNGIGEEGANLILEALKVNKTLTSIDFSANGIGGDVEKLIFDAVEVNKNYIKEIAAFLSEKYSTSKNEIKKFNFKADKITENLPQKMKYFKAYQVINKELLACELKSKGIEDTELFLNEVDNYIKEHLFQLSGVAKDPVVELIRENFKGEKGHSFIPNESVKSGSKRKLKEDTDEGSNKSIKTTDVIKSNLFNDPLISASISEFLGDCQTLSEIKVIADSEVIQVGDNLENV